MRATASPLRQQPPRTLFTWAGVAEPAPRPLPFDPRRLLKLALGIWRVSIDARHAVLFQRYLAAAGLTPPDGIGDELLRFHPRLKLGEGGRAPGLLWLLRDVLTSEPAGILRVYLDGAGHVIGRRRLGRAWGAAIKLDGEVSGGLHISTDLEAALAARTTGMRPVWCLANADALADFPLIPGVDCLTIISSDNDSPRAIDLLTARYRGAERQVIFAVAGLRYTATVGRFRDGTIGELFLSNHKCNSGADVAARDAAIAFSFAVQHGANPEAIRKALCRNPDGTASGPLGAALDMLADGK